MSDVLKRKARLADKLPQLPGYLPEQVACAVIVRLGRRGERKTEPNTSGITVNGQHYSPSSPSPSFLSIFPPRVPCETVGAILCAANRAVFLVPVSISSHRRTKRGGVVKEKGFVGEGVLAHIITCNKS